MNIKEEQNDIGDKDEHYEHDVQDGQDEGNEQDWRDQQYEPDG